MASPDPKRQQQEQQQQAPPEYKPFEEEPKQKRNPINDENAAKIETWLNNFKSGFYKFLNEKFPSSYKDSPNANFKIRNALGSVEALNFYLWEYLSLYRGEFIGYYLNESAMELLYSALGPVGNMWRLGNKTKMNWRMAWQKNLLNPNAIYYYFHSLPQLAAFKLLKNPVSGAFSILAKGGAPLVSRVHTQEYDQQGKEVVVTKYVFSPAYRLTQLNHNLVNKFNALSGIEEPKTVNEKLSDWLLKLKQAKTKDEKNNAIAGLQKELFKIDGSPLKRAFANAARRLGAYERDPITNLLSFIIGGLVDFTIGAIVNGVKNLAIRAASMIPGFTVLRGRIINFLTSNPWLNTARLGGITTQAFARGVFSPTTLSSSYLGSRTASLIGQGIAFFNPELAATLNPYLGVGLGSIFGGLGAFYQTSLILTRYGLRDYAGHLMHSGWTQRIQALEAISKNPAISLAERQIALNELKSISLKGFKPGPFTRFGSWLYQRPFARLPINGLAVADLGVRFLGWNPWIAYPSFIAADWLWQVKGPLFDKFMSKWLQPTWKIFKWQTPSFHARFQNLSMRISRFYWEKIAHVWSPGTLSFTERGWFKYTNQALKFGKPFAQNFFNPGFFMGFGLIPWFSTFMPTPLAYIAAPVAGSLVWNGTAFMLERTFGMRIASMARLNALGWAGYITGSVLQLIFPNFFPPWFSIATSIAFPLGGMIFSALNINLVSLIASGLSSIVSIFSTTAAAAITASPVMAAWAAAISIATVAGLTIFFAYTIYAGFWVPMIEESTAGPQSNNFTIKNNCAQTGSNQYNCCSNFRITEDVLNSQKWLEHKFDFRTNYLTVNLADPAQTTDAFRGQQLDFIPFNPPGLTPNDYTIPPPDDPPIVGYAQPVQILETFLSAPTEEPQTLKELMATNSSVVYSMKPFFDILTALAKEHTGAKHLVAEYQAQLKLFESQKELVDALVNNISAGSLSQALKAANDYKAKNPLTDPCPGEADCPSEKQGLKNLFDSWEPTIKRYIDTITRLLAQTDPDLDNFLAQLEQEQAGLQQQIDLLPGIIRQMLEIQRRINSDDKANEIIELSTKFLSYTSLSPEDQDKIWNLLNDYFPDVFNERGKFFFIPQGTNYRVCVLADYCKGPDPTVQPVCPRGEPQTVCSTISYQPSIWGPNTSFAKACTTFTPQ